MSEIMSRAERFDEQKNSVNTMSLSVFLDQVDSTGFREIRGGSSKVHGFSLDPEACSQGQPLDGGRGVHRT